MKRAIRVWVQCLVVFSWVVVLGTGCDLGTTGTVKGKLHGACTPGEWFEASDGCNSCYCPASGKVDDATDCTLMECPEHCTTDAECGSGATPPYCVDTVAYATTAPTCNTETNQCEVKEVRPPKDCAAEGLACFQGECVDDSDTCTPGEVFAAGCNECKCPDSGKKSEASCTDQVCKCLEDSECGDGATPPYCEGNMLHTFTAPYCNKDSGQCESGPKPDPQDCSLDGLTCVDGACVIPSDVCTPGEFFADDCNDCECPPSGKKSEAACTELDCGCKADIDCGAGATPPYCEGDVAYASEAVWCNPETSQCEMKEVGPPQDCAAKGLQCVQGECVPNDDDTCIPGEGFLAPDGCNTCSCPDSGKKSEAPCTLMECWGCKTDADCADGILPPYCEGDIAYVVVAPICQVETGNCLATNEVLKTDCAADGLTCSAGECVVPDKDSCTPGESFEADDCCNSCTCPQSGKKSEAACTEIACQCACTQDSDCDYGYKPAYCEDSIAHPFAALVCDPFEGMCVPFTNFPPVDCASSGLECLDGQCI